MTRKLLLALGALLLALAAVELLVRLVRPQAAGSGGVAALLRGEFTRPGDHPNRSAEFSVTVHVNREGFVDREWGPKRPGVPRVVLLGDSFVAAAQVPLEQGLGRALEREVERAHGAQVEVLSMGVPGAGTATALGLLETRALPREPDLVLLAFLVSNDVLNNHALLEPKSDKPFFRLEAGELLATDAQGSLDSAWSRGPLWAHSHAWRWVARGVLRRRIATQKLELGAGMPIDLRVHDPAGGPTWDEAWQITDALVGTISDRCREQGVSFATLLLPSAVEATRDGREAAIAAWPALAGWDLTLAFQRAASLAGEHGPVLDLRPVLERVQDGTPLYYAQDGHWTPRGHQAAAAGAAQLVAGLLPAVEATETQPPE